MQLIGVILSETTGRQDTVYNLCEIKVSCKYLSVH